MPLNGLQQGALTVLSALGALASPRRADLVATVGETSAGPALNALRRRMALDPRGADILAERPRVTDTLLLRAGSLPPNTFGGAYAAFMAARGFSADERPPVRFVADAELAYIVTRAREVHDFWHVLFGCHTNVLGEVALKAVEFLQVPGGADATAQGDRVAHVLAETRAEGLGTLVLLCSVAGLSCWGQHAPAHTNPHRADRPPDDGAGGGGRRAPAAGCAEGRAERHVPAMGAAGGRTGRRPHVHPVREASGGGGLSPGPGNVRGIESGPGGACSAGRWTTAKKAPPDAFPRRAQDNLEELRRRYRIVVAPRAGGAAGRAAAGPPAYPGVSVAGPIGQAYTGDDGTAAQLQETSAQLGPV